MTKKLVTINDPPGDLIPVVGFNSGAPIYLDTSLDAPGENVLTVPTNKFVDAVAGNDGNDGDTPSTAWQTVGRVNRFWSGLTIAAALTVTFLTDMPNTTPLNPSLIAGSLVGGSLSLVGTPIVVHTGTLTAGTVAMNPAAASGGQRQIVEDTGIASFGPFVDGEFQLVVTSGPNNGNAVWLAKEGDSPTKADAGPPTAPDGTQAPVASGNPYAIRRGSHLTYSAVTTPPTNELPTTFTDFLFENGTDGFQGEIRSEFAPLTFQRCSWAGLASALIVTSGLPVVLVDCCLGSTQSGAALFVQGGLYFSEQDDAARLWIFQGDTYVTGFGIVISGNATEFAGSGSVNIIVFAGTGAGVQFQDCTNEGALVIQAAAVVLGTGAFAELDGTGLPWGNGNAAYGIFMRLNGLAAVSSTDVPSVTGATGDVGFESPNTAVVTASAQPYNAGAGTYSATTAFSWSNFNATFGFNAHRPQSGIVLIGGRP